MLMLFMLQVMVPAILCVVLLGTRHRLTVSTFYLIVIVNIHGSFVINRPFSEFQPELKLKIGNNILEAIFAPSNRERFKQWNT